MGIKEEQPPSIPEIPKQIEKKEEVKKAVDPVDILKDVEPQKQQSETKKVRTFVAENDLFDFSDVKIVTGDLNKNVPVVDEKTKSSNKNNDIGAGGDPISKKQEEAKKVETKKAQQALLEE